MTTKTCLVLGTGTAKPGIIEDGLDDQPDDMSFLVLWHDKEYGDQTSMRRVLQWLVKNQRNFVVLTPKGTKFPQPVIDAAEDLEEYKDPLGAINDVCHGSEITYALLAFSDNALNGRDFCEETLSFLIRQQYPVYELNNGCVPLSIVVDPPTVLDRPMMDEIDEGDALESESLQEFTDRVLHGVDLKEVEPVEDVLIATLIFPGGNAIWRRVTHSEAEKFFDLT